MTTESQTAPLVEMAHKPMQRSRSRVRNVVACACVLVVVATIDLFLNPIFDSTTSKSDGGWFDGLAQSMALGAICSQGPLLAFAAVFAPGRPLVRLLLVAFLWVLMMYAVLWGAAQNNRLTEDDALL